MVVGDFLRNSAACAPNRLALIGRDRRITYGEFERETNQLANALIAHIGTSMAGGPAVESGGGLLYDQAEIYVFLDRVDDQVFWIASTNKAAGADLRSQLGL